MAQDNLEVMLTDFGFSCFIDPEEGLDNFLGTPQYMAPELINNKKYDEKVDIWALGVIAYQLLAANNVPFNTKEQINNLTLTFPKSTFPGISASAKDFI